MFTIWAEVHKYIDRFRDTEYSNRGLFTRRAVMPEERCALQEWWPMSLFSSLEPQRRANGGKWREELGGVI